MSTSTTETDVVEAAGEELAALEQLERRVEEAAALIRDLRVERDRLREQLAEREARVGELEAGLAEAGAERDQVTRLEKERDDLLRSRAATAQRVQAILERLESMERE